MKPEEYKQLAAFARIDGLYLGLLWIVSFSCFIGNFSHPMLGSAAMLIALYSPFFVARRLKKFRDTARDGIISFRRALAYSMFVFFYGSLIFAVAQYVYFAFIDGGYVINQYSKMFSTPEAKQMINALFGNDMQMKRELLTMSEIRPIELALNFLSCNISVGIITSVPIAAILKRQYIKKTE